MASSVRSAYAGVIRSARTGECRRYTPWPSVFPTQTLRLVWAAVAVGLGARCDDGAGVAWTVALVALSGAVGDTAAVGATARVDTALPQAAHISVSQITKARTK